MRTRNTPPKFEGLTVSQSGLAFRGKIEGGPVLDLGADGYVIVRVTVSDVDHPRRADGAVERLHKLAVTEAVILDDDTDDDVLAIIHELVEKGALEADRRAGKEPLPLRGDDDPDLSALTGDEK